MFSKVILIVIAILLGIIALKPLFKVEPIQANPGGLDYAQCTGIFARLGGSNPVYGMVCLDTRNGKIWWINLDDGQTEFKGTLNELGKPLTRQ